MIRRLSAVLATAALLWSLGALTPADAGQSNTIDVVKVVEGPVPAGTEFVIEVLCAEEGGTDTASDTFIFPETGGSDSLAGIGGEWNCEVTETDDGGADSVSYACEAMPDDPQATFSVSCTSDRTVSYPGFNGDGATVTVTNTFSEDAEPAVDDTEAEVVEATPTFTG